MFRKLFNKFRNFTKKKEPTILEVQSDAVKSNWDKKFEIVTEYERDGILFKLGDKVITKSNECDPYMLGVVVEFWTNGGKWLDSPMFQVKEEGTETVWSVMGIIRPYSVELENEIKDLRPLEQWNHFVHDIHKFTEEQMVRKEKQYEMVQNKKRQLTNS